MKCLRIRISQNKAHYRKEESITNKMTYPLPPYSTIIGALHNACGYIDYQNMSLSIQGKYESMQKEPYTDHAFLNSVMDDRGILVKLQNPYILNSGYHIIAKALKGQGNSFRDGKTIDIIDEKGIQEYRELLEKRQAFSLEKKEVLDPKISDLKLRIKKLKGNLKYLEKKSEEYLKIQKEIKDIDNEKKTLEIGYKNRKDKEYDIPYSYFASLTTSIRYYEVLYGVELVIHIQSDEDILMDIENNIWNLSSIGRSEDFVEVTDIQWVNLISEFDDTHKNKYFSAYVDCKSIENGDIFISEGSRTVGGIPARGTKYYMNKNYTVKENKRQFKKNWILYISDYGIDECSKDVYLDSDGYIVSLI